MEAIDSKTPDALIMAQYYWEEYKYRHDHIWQRIFTLTTAIVLISIIPYIQQDVVRLLRNWILIAPILAFLLASFVFLVMDNELELFGRIKKAYRRQQNRHLDNDLKHQLDGKSSFEMFVKAFFGILLALTVINGLIVFLVWIPKVVAQPFCPCL